MRSPLWMQRKRAADLLAVAARYPAFPILLETYRECVRDVFDLAGASDVLRQIQDGRIRVTALDSLKPSPFASTLLFSYIANYIYDGDAPLAERRAQALAIDQSQLEEILGTTDFRELLDRVALEEIEAQLQSLDPEYHARHADGLHDLLLKLGDLSASEIVSRSATAEVAATIDGLTRARRALEVRIAGETRYIPVEYAARYRDALGVPLPPGLAGVFLERAANPLVDLVRRYARTHGPFTTAEAAHRYGLEPAKAEASLQRLHAEGKLLEGEFRPDGIHREWCDPDILQRVRRRSLARLRREVEPAAQQTFARMLTRWQGVTAPRRGSDALLDAVEILQGAAIPASELEREILPARVLDYGIGDIDSAIAAGDVVWLGRGSIGDRDGRIALYLADSLAHLLPPVEEVPELSDRARLILGFLETRGASFFAPIHEACGGGFPGETTAAVWELVWAGLITNDTLQPVRQLLAPRADPRSGGALRYGQAGSAAFLRQRRANAGHGNAGQGRWSLIRQRIGALPTPAEWSAAMSRQLLVRYGIVMRETALADSVPGGYQSVYPALRTMEESGWVRRGMFVESLGAAQFALGSAVDLLRSLRVEPDRPETVHLAASDPSNPYGAVLPWPDSGAHGLARASGASVILVNGRLAAYLRRRNPEIRAFLPESEPELTRVAVALAHTLAQAARRRQSRKDGLLIAHVNGEPARDHFLAVHLEAAGFVNTASGYQMRRAAPPGINAAAEPQADEEDAVERG